MLNGIDLLSGMMPPLLLKWSTKLITCETISPVALSCTINIGRSCSSMSLEF